jgi:hypothetical protein
MTAPKEDMTMNNYKPKLTKQAHELIADELTAAELEEVTGGNLVCANGAHIQQGTLTVREPRTPVAYFGGIPIY